MVKRDFELAMFSKGYFLVWEVCTQCQNKVEVTLKIGDTTYSLGSKTNSSTSFQLLSQGSADMTVSATPILTVTVKESTALIPVIASTAITDACARKVGFIYSICIEDSDDEDYNDVYVNIVGWEKKG